MLFPRDSVVLHPTLDPATHTTGHPKQTANFSGGAEVDQDWHCAAHDRVVNQHVRRVEVVVRRAE